MNCYYRPKGVDELLWFLLKWTVDHSVQWIPAEIASDTPRTESECAKPLGYSEFPFHSCSKNYLKPVNISNVV